MRAFVHHMLIYLCSSPLNATRVGETGPCHAVSSDIGACRGSRKGVLIAAWAVGAEVYYIYNRQIIHYIIDSSQNSYHLIIIYYYRILYILRMWHCH